MGLQIKMFKLTLVLVLAVVVGQINGRPSSDHVLTAESQKKLAMFRQMLQAAENSGLGGNKAGIDPAANVDNAAANEGNAAVNAGNAAANAGDAAAGANVNAAVNAGDAAANAGDAAANAGNAAANAGDAAANAGDASATSNAI